MIDSDNKYGKSIGTMQVIILVCWAASATFEHFLAFIVFFDWRRRWRIFQDALCLLETSTDLQQIKGGEEVVAYTSNSCVIIFVTEIVALV